VGEVDVELNGAALPSPAHAVLQFEVEFRAIESAIARIDRIFVAGVLAGLGQDGFGFVPIFDRADIVFLGAGRQDDLVAEAKDLIDLIEDGHDGLDFAFDLVEADENMGIILGEGPNPE